MSVKLERRKEGKNQERQPERWIDGIKDLTDVDINVQQATTRQS